MFRYLLRFEDLGELIAANLQLFAIYRHAREVLGRVAIRDRGILRR